MQFFNINRNSLGIIVVRVIAAAIFMIVALLLDRPAVADQPAAATVVPQQPSLDDAFQDFADRMALDRRLRTLEQKIHTLVNTAQIVPQQPQIADPPQDFADRIGLDQRLQRLELQIQSLLNMQIEILLNTRKRAVQTRTETFPKSWVSPKQTTTKYRYRRRHEIDATALGGETVDANPAAQRGTNASGCPASVPCVKRGTAPFTAPTATPEYDEAGVEIK